ncbi:MAG: rhodanese-like domain-containing protein [Actinomycetia bacterium]|nr:rhodanese-like domain-containing protein [Actinomycetes bacterium]
MIGLASPGEAFASSPATVTAQLRARLLTTSSTQQRIRRHRAESGRVTINVHVPYEGDTAGTDLSIPFDQITELGDLLPQQRSTPLAIYCRSGRMSAIAPASLTSLGYLDVVDLRGGMKAWQDSGRSLLWQ